MEKTNKNWVKDYFQANYLDGDDVNHCGGATFSAPQVLEIAQDITKESRTQTIEEIINELGSNPNEDNSQSPNIQHWIEQKQSQLKRKYLNSLK